MPDDALKQAFAAMSRQHKAFTDLDLARHEANVARMAQVCALTSIAFREVVLALKENASGIDITERLENITEHSSTLWECSLDLAKSLKKDG